MASGLPVVAAAAGGVPSVIGRPGAAGVLFPPGDADVAAVEVQRLACDAGARARMAVEARSEMERFSWKSATHEILYDFYPAARAMHSARSGGIAAASANRPDVQP